MHLLNPKICTFEIKNEVFRQTAVSSYNLTTAQTQTDNKK